MSFINNWLRSDIKALKAYNVPQSFNMIKLDAMESPFTMPYVKTDKYLASISAANINRYPESHTLLKKTLHKLMDIPDNFDILLGNGSDELIQLLALACNKDSTILSFEPSFSMYKIITKITNLNYKGISLNANFDIDITKTLLAIKKHRPKLIFIAYPNNPTGNTFCKKSIIDIIKKTDALVVLDEAYYAYTNHSFLPDINTYANLVVLRTISKIGFAGLRLGLLVGSKETIQLLNKLRLPYNINTLTQISARMFLQKKPEIAKNTKAIITARLQLIASLSLIKQLKVYPSKTNFVLFTAPHANNLYKKLKTHNILIKNLSASPMLYNCMRVTVGSEAENTIFINVIKNYYAK